MRDCVSRFSRSFRTGRKGADCPGFRTRAGGFTIVEMAIVLVVLGLLLSSALTPLRHRWENGKYEDERERIEQRRQALVAYATQNRTEERTVVLEDLGWSYTIPAGRPYLPCPDIDGDGLEDRLATSGLPDSGTAITLESASNFRGIAAAGGCQHYQGLFPWGSVGTEANDTWGRLYIYRVHPSFSNNVSGFDHLTRADVYDETSGLVVSTVTVNYAGKDLVPTSAISNDSIRFLYNTELSDQATVTVTTYQSLYESTATTTTATINGVTAVLVHDERPFGVCAPGVRAAAGATVTMSAHCPDADAVAGVALTMSTASNVVEFDPPRTGISGPLLVRAYMGSDNGADADDIPRSFKEGVVFGVVSTGQNGYGGFVRNAAGGLACGSHPVPDEPSPEVMHLSLLKNVSGHCSTLPTSYAPHYEGNLYYLPRTEPTTFEADSETSSPVGFDDVIGWMGPDEFVGKLARQDVFPVEMYPYIGLPLDSTTVAMSVAPALGVDYTGAPGSSVTIDPARDASGSARFVGRTDPPLPLSDGTTISLTVQVDQEDGNTTQVPFRFDTEDVTLTLEATGAPCVDDMDTPLPEITGGDSCLISVTGRVPADILLSVTGVTVDDFVNAAATIQMVPFIGTSPTVSLAHPSVAILTPNSAAGSIVFAPSDVFYTPAVAPGLEMLATLQALYIPEADGVPQTLTLEAASIPAGVTLTLGGVPSCISVGVNMCEYRFGGMTTEFDATLSAQDLTTAASFSVTVAGGGAVLTIRTRTAPFVDEFRVLGGSAATTYFRTGAPVLKRFALKGGGLQPLERLTVTVSISSNRMTSSEKFINTDISVATPEAECYDNVMVPPVQATMVGHGDHCVFELTGSNEARFLLRLNELRPELITLTTTPTGLELALRETTSTAPGVYFDPRVLPYITATPTPGATRLAGATLHVSTGTGAAPSSDFVFTLTSAPPSPIVLAAAFAAGVTPSTCSFSGGTTLCALTVASTSLPSGTYETDVTVDLTSVQELVSAGTPTLTILWEAHPVLLTRPIPNTNPYLSFLPDTASFPAAVNPENRPFGLVTMDYGNLAGNRDITLSATGLPALAALTLEEGVLTPLTCRITAGTPCTVSVANDLGAVVFMGSIENAHVLSAGDTVTVQWNGNDVLEVEALPAQPLNVVGSPATVRYAPTPPGRGILQAFERVTVDYSPVDPALTSITLAITASGLQTGNSLSGDPMLPGQNVQFTPAASVQPVTLTTTTPGDFTFSLNLTLAPNRLETGSTMALSAEGLPFLSIQPATLGFMPASVGYVNAPGGMRSLFDVNLIYSGNVSAAVANVFLEHEGFDFPQASDRFLLSLNTTPPETCDLHRNAPATCDWTFPLTGGMANIPVDVSQFSDIGGGTAYLKYRGVTVLTFMPAMPTLSISPNMATFDSLLDGAQPAIARFSYSQGHPGALATDVTLTVSGIRAGNSHVLQATGINCFLGADGECAFSFTTGSDGTYNLDPFAVTQFDRDSQGPHPITVSWNGQEIFVWTPIPPSISANPDRFQFRAGTSGNNSDRVSPPVTVTYSSRDVNLSEAVLTVTASGLASGATIAMDLDIMPAQSCSFTRVAAECVVTLESPSSTGEFEQELRTTLENPVAQGDANMTLSTIDTDFYILAPASVTLGFAPNSGLFDQLGIGRRDHRPAFSYSQGLPGASNTTVTLTVSGLMGTGNGLNMDVGTNSCSLGQLIGTFECELTFTTQADGTFSASSLLRLLRVQDQDGNPVTISWDGQEVFVFEPTPPSISASPDSSAFTPTATPQVFRSVLSYASRDTGLSRATITVTASGLQTNVTVRSRFDTSPRRTCDFTTVASQCVLTLSGPDSSGTFDHEMTVTLRNPDDQGQSNVTLSWEDNDFYTLSVPMSLLSFTPRGLLFPFNVEAVRIAGFYNQRPPAFSYYTSSGAGTYDVTLAESGLQTGNQIFLNLDRFGVDECSLVEDGTCSFAVTVGANNFASFDSISFRTASFADQTNTVTISWDSTPVLIVTPPSPGSNADFGFDATAASFRQGANLLDVADRIITVGFDYDYDNPAQPGGFMGRIPAPLLTLTVTGLQTQVSLDTSIRGSQCSWTTNGLGCVYNMSDSGTEGMFSDTLLMTLKMAGRQGTSAITLQWTHPVSGTSADVLTLTPAAPAESLRFDPMTVTYTPSSGTTPASLGDVTLNYNSASDSAVRQFVTITWNASNMSSIDEIEFRNRYIGVNQTATLSPTETTATVGVEGNYGILSSAVTIYATDPSSLGSETVEIDWEGDTVLEIEAATP